MQIRNILLSCLSPAGRRLDLSNSTNSLKKPPATSCAPRMKKLSSPETLTSPAKPSQFAAECWFDDACILDMDYFVKTLSGIKAKGVRHDLIGSIITHYAYKWLPDLSGGDVTQKSGQTNCLEESSGSVTASWMKKRFFVETIVGVLPPEKDSIPCNFLLRLLRTANMVGVEPTYIAELERRISWQLEDASLKELMIPSFSHTCGTLLDVELVIRLVKRFVDLDENAKTGASLIKVAKLVDCYLAEAALDLNMSLSELVALAGALPAHARASDDGLYRAIDTYLKAHPAITKEERKSLCRLIDSRKLSQEASLHAAQNERLPVRAVIQVLFCEQNKLFSRQIDWSGCSSLSTNTTILTGTSSWSPNPGLNYMEPAASRNCYSKREMTSQQMEIKRLKEDVFWLQRQCEFMQAQIERLTDHEKKIKKKKAGFLKWNKFGVMPSLIKSSVNVIEKIEEVDQDEAGLGRETPLMDMKTKLMRGRTPPNRRRSMS